MTGESTTSAPRRLFHGMARLGSGELLARLFSVSTVILLGHFYGVVIVGIYGLATSVAQYLIPIIDFGLKHVGARLLARFPHSASEIVQRVQRRRRLMASLAIPFVLLYASLTHLPFEFKVFLFLFSSTTALYAFSLDWAAWGREQMLLVGLAKAIAPACILVGLLIAMARGRLLSWLVVGNLIGFVLQGLLFWLWWQRHRRGVGEQEQGVAEIVEALLWRRTSIMGLAWLGNLAFNTIDMLMLGVLSNPEQVGLYSAAYRILNQVLITYYLLTTVLYPQLARQDDAQRRHMLRPSVLLLLFSVGTALALLLAVFRQPLLALLFGNPFVVAAPLLLLLTAAIPLDFLTSYLSNAYIAWGFEKRVLVCTVVAAAVEIVLNAFGIPRFGALAAAVNTLIAYLVLLVGLALVAKWLNRMPRPRAEEIL